MGTMTDDDPDRLKGPGGLTLRQVHEQVRQSVERDREAQKMRSELARKRSWWQRFVRYLRDRKRV
jgi:hypothetical protein